MFKIKFINFFQIKTLVTSSRLHLVINRQFFHFFNAFVTWFKKVYFNNMGRLPFLSEKLVACSAIKKILVFQQIYNKRTEKKYLFTESKIAVGSSSNYN